MWSKTVALDYAPLPLTLKHHPLEPATSFLSRLAARNGALSVREFCRDIRFPYAALVAGKPFAIRLLSQLGGCDAAALAYALIRNSGGNAFRLREEIATAQSLQRSRIRICPKCIQEDIGDTQDIWRAWRRLSWQFTSIRSCATHHCELVSLPAEKFTLRGYDFAAQMRLHWSSINQSTLQPCAHSCFETWLTARIGGRRGMTWIDRLELNVASRACEVLGLRLVKGPGAGLSGHEPSDWACYANVGYQVLCDGVGAFEYVLSGMLKEEGVDRRFSSKVYGPLTTWLNGRGLGDEFEPLKSLVRAHIFENFSVRRGILVLGRASVGKSGNSQSVVTAGLSKRLIYIMFQRGLAAEGVDGNAVLEGFVTQAMIASLKREALEHIKAIDRLPRQHAAVNIIRSATENPGAAMTANEVVNRLKITKPTVLYLCRNGLLLQLQNKNNGRVGSVAICRKSVATFERTFASLGHFSTQAICRQGALAIKLKNTDIPMLAMPPKYSRIYWQTDLETFSRGESAD